MALKQIPVPNTIIHNAPPPLVEVHGTHREMGCQIGEACREQVQHSIENAHLLIEQSYSNARTDLGWGKIQSRKYLPFAEERYPQYVDEMRGIAEGANVTFDDVMVLNAMEAVTMDALHLTRCTSFAVNEERTADGHVLAAHNEDWVPEDENDVYVISAKPKDEPPFLAMTYGGLLPNVGSTPMALPS
jgi:isopenicillin-N N-acyltransferase like protein